MSLLVRLYPQAWRDRYADEFEAMLEEMPITPAIVGDVVVAAARARARFALEVPISLTLAAVAGIAGGLLWALTFGVGFAVGWGRYGHDLGFILLIGAAVAIFIAQVRVASAWFGIGRTAARLGLVVSGVGVVVLLAGLLAAIVLEPPLVFWLGHSPTEIWSAGMLLTVGGGMLMCAAAVHAAGRHAITVAFIAAAALPLAVALLMPLDRGASHVEYRLAADGTRVIVSAGRSVPEQGWFTRNLVVGVAGVVFGLGWLAVGVGESRTVGHRPRPKAPGDTRTA